MGDKKGLRDLRYSQTLLQILSFRDLCSKSWHAYGDCYYLFSFDLIYASVMNEEISRTDSIFTYLIVSNTMGSSLFHLKTLNTMFKRLISLHSLHVNILIDEMQISIT